MSIIVKNWYNLAALMAIFIMVSCIGALPLWVSNLIFLAYGISAFVCFQKLQKILYIYAVYIAFLALTILVDGPDPVFRSWNRFFVFCIFFAFASPLLQSKYIREFRQRMFDYSMKICVAISVISFFCYFLNINLFINRFEGGYLSDYEEFIGHFSGITKHSMLLGPIAGLSVIHLLKQVIIKKAHLSWLLLAFSLGSLLFSASRGAIISTAVAVVVYLLPILKSKTSNSKYKLLGILFVLVTFPYYRPYIESSFNKHQNMVFGDYDSRSGKVEARIQEFEKNPFTGVGFAAIDTNGKDVYDKESGAIEPGSSWLAVLSMTGIFGGFFFLFFVCKAYTNARRKNNYLIIAYLWFFIVHLLVEGYLFSVGSALACLFWLVLSIAHDQRYISGNKIND